MTDKETLSTFEDAIRQHLIENRQELVKASVLAAMERMADSLKYTAMSQAQEQLKEFFTKEVGPEVQKYLDAEKENLIASVVSTIKEVIDYGLKKQAEDWMKSMDSEYSRAGVIGKMFGGKAY